MSEQNPYQQLGVTENSSFEEIQVAKESLLQQYREDSQSLESIEAAYDAIIMDRLRMRQEGKIKVPERIRYPEREQTAESTVKFNPLSVKTPPSWLKGWIDTPAKTDILISAAVFATLMAITIFVAGTQISLLLTLGLFANVYFLNRKENRFWRSVLITIGVLCLGIALGASLATVIATTINLDVQQLYALVTLVLFWLCSSFLR
jgi:hypothetical protein